MRWLIVLTALLTGAVLAVTLAVIVSAGRSQDQLSQFTQWEQCELQSNGWGQAGDPCGSMPVP